MLRPALPSLAPWLALLLLGCRAESEPDDRLTVATSWSASERTELEHGFERWVREQPGAAPGRPRIEWIVMAPADDPARVPVGPSLWPGRSPDVLLGGPASSYRRLERAGRLSALDSAEPRAWRVARRSALGWAMTTEAASATNRRPGLSFDDPRRDPLALAWARAELAAGSWDEGYARLVREAGHAVRIGRIPGASLAAVERGELEVAPAAASSVPERADGPVFRPMPRAPEWIEGVAVVAGRGRQTLARAFVRFLAEQGRAELPAGPSTTDPDPDGLLADLLGATLVDAQDELWIAWRTLERAGHPRQAEHWMTMAPPWPPASVARLGQRDPTGSLMATLAEQVAPDPATRAWLLRSWLEPERPIDGAWLAMLGQAAEGRLAREPRFRAWLRAEWTAWARQRYRRVARTAQRKDSAS